MDLYLPHFVFRKVPAIGLSILVGALQYAPLQAESSFWESRRTAVQRRAAPPQTLSVSAVGEGVLPLGREKVDPSSLLGLRRVSPVGSAPTSHVKNPLTLSQRQRKTVYLIQDIHQNAQAQGNIARAIQSLIEKGGTEFVALESAFGPIDLSRFARFPDQESVQEGAKYLMGQNRISGPVLAVFSSSSLVPLIGVDDRAHYLANVDAYRRSLPGSTEIKTRWAQAKQSLQEQKKRVFNSRLATFDGNVEAYQDGHLSLGDYIESVPIPIDPGFPQAVKFIEAHRREKKIDFKRVETDRTSLVRELADRLTPNQYSSLVDLGAAYREGRIRYAGIYTHLSALCRDASIHLTRYPALNEYIRYVVLADGIDAERLFTEIHRLEKKGYDAVAVTPAEKSLVKESRSHRLTGKLLDFSLTREEWDEYERVANSLDAPERQPFESFYREALARDEAMSRNLLSLFESRGASKAVLVSGGFHSRGIEERLKAAGLEIIAYVPQIDRIDSDAGTALSVFSKEKSPLDTLFRGQKLFLAAPPIAPEVRDTQLPLIVAARRFAMMSAQALESQREGTVRSDFVALSTHPDAPKATVRAYRLPDNQVGVQVTSNGVSASLLVQFKGPRYEIVAEKVFRPGEERTLEWGRRWFGSIFSDSVVEKVVRVGLAPLVEWSVFTRGFLVNHHPETFEEWMDILSIRNRILSGALAGSLVGALLVLLFPAGPVVNLSVVVGGTLLGKIIVQSGLNAIRDSMGLPTATESMPFHLSDPEAVDRGQRINQNPASLDTELMSAWDEKMASGKVYNFNLQDVVWISLDRFRKVFNPGRSGKRPRQMDIADLNQPFNPDAFHFDSPNMKPAEILAEGVIVNGIETDFVANVNPLKEGHFLINPKRRSRHNQYFSRMAALVALGTIEMFGSRLKIGYNSVGAFASINHLHLQGVPYETGDKMPMEKEFANSEKRTLLRSDGGLQLWQLTEWPIKGYVLTGHDQEALANRLVEMADVLQKENQPFNIIFTRKEDGEFVIFLMPRQPEKSTRFGTGAAFFECSGEFLFIQQAGKSQDQSIAEFQEADEQDLHDDLAAFDLDETRKKEIQKKILATFPASVPDLYEEEIAYYPPDRQSVKRMVLDAWEREISIMDTGMDIVDEGNKVGLIFKWRGGGTGILVYYDDDGVVVKVSEVVRGKDDITHFNVQETPTQRVVGLNINSGETITIPLKLSTAPSYVIKKNVSTRTSPALNGLPTNGLSSVAQRVAESLRNSLAPLGDHGSRFRRGYNETGLNWMISSEGSGMSYDPQIIKRVEVQVGNDGRINVFDSRDLFIVSRANTYNNRYGLGEDPELAPHEKEGSPIVGIVLPKNIMENILDVTLVVKDLSFEIMRKKFPHVKMIKESELYQNQATLQPDYIGAPIEVPRLTDQEEEKPFEQSNPGERERQASPRSLNDLVEIYYRALSNWPWDGEYPRMPENPVDLLTMLASLSEKSVDASNEEILSALQATSDTLGWQALEKILHPSVVRMHSTEKYQGAVAELLRREWRGLGMTRIEGSQHGAIYNVGDWIRQVIVSLGAYLPDVKIYAATGGALVANRFYAREFLNNPAVRTTDGVYVPKGNAIILNLSPTDPLALVGAVTARAYYHPLFLAGVFPQGLSFPMIASCLEIFWLMETDLIPGDASQRLRTYQESPFREFDVRKHVNIPALVHAGEEIFKAHEVERARNWKDIQNILEKAVLDVTKRNLSGEHLETATGYVLAGYIDAIARSKSHGSPTRVFILKTVLELATRGDSQANKDGEGMPGAFKFWEKWGVSRVWAGRIEGAPAAVGYLALFIFQVVLLNAPLSDMSWLEMAYLIITPALPIVSIFLIGHLFGVYGKDPKDFKERLNNALRATWTASWSTLLVPSIVAIALATQWIAPTGLALGAVFVVTAISSGWLHGEANRRRTAIQSALPLEPFSVNDLNHRWAFVHQVSQQIRAGDPAAREWAKTVDTLATLAVVRQEDIPILRSLLAKTVPADGQNNLHFLLVPANEDSALAESLNRLAKEDRRFTLLHPGYAPGLIRLPSQEIADWAQGKGRIFWTAFKNPTVQDAIVSDVDTPPADLQSLLDLLRSAPPIGAHDFNALFELARAVLIAA
jgi:hypothetical protein